MKNLKLTIEDNPKNPKDGEPYVFYNKDKVETWIFMGLQWILEDGKWDDAYSWTDDGRWNYWGPPSA